MQNQDMPAHDRETLEAIAELLLWIGWDRIADRIYEQIEAMGDPLGYACPGEWDEVFGG